MSLHQIATPTAPAPGAGALHGYLSAIRAHWRLMALVTLAALAGSVAWLVLRSPSYEATAQVLVSPLPQGDDALLGLQVVRDSPGEPTRAVQTAATLVDSPTAAGATARRLGGDWSARSVADAIEVDPEGQSNILSITGNAGSPREAARLANQFVRSSLDQRRSILSGQATTALARLDVGGQLPPPTGDEPATLAERRAALESIRTTGDPSLSMSQTAVAGTRTGAPPAVVLALALLAGLSLGAGAAVLRELLDRSIGDETEAVSLYPLPVLARVPLMTRRERRAAPRDVWYMPPSVREAFRTLMTQVERGDRSGGTVMLTSASTGDGKTTSAINLAVAMAAAGHSVVLLDFDLRKPEIGRQLGIDAVPRLSSMLRSDADVADLLRSLPELPSLQVLSPGVEAGDTGLVDALNRRVAEIIEQARAVAEWVIVDTAPLGEVSDALRATPVIDDIVVVVRPGSTSRVNFEMMRDLLERVARSPLGMLMIGQPAGMSSSYYAYGAGRRELFRQPGSVG